MSKAVRQETGAVALLVAFSLIALTVAAGMVLDFGLARLDRQQNKLAADAAATAGLSYGVNKKTGEIWPFKAGCEAYRYLVNNQPALASGLTGSWSTAADPSDLGDICATGSLDGVVCDPTDAATWAVFRGRHDDPDIDVEIKSGYQLSDGAFPEETTLDSLVDDPSEAGGCDQVAVILKEGRSPGLGSLATTADLVSRVRSVARVTVLPPDSPIALLILEQKDCAALAITAGGAEGRIDVHGVDEHPGLIHVDSDGSGDQCGAKPIIEGKNPGSLCPDPPLATDPTCGGIVAHESEDGTAPGRITTFASANTSDGTPRVYAGPYPGADPTQRDRITRKVVDDIYLEGVTQAVADAADEFGAAATGTAPATYTEFPTCDSVPAVVNAANAFIKCSTFDKPLTFNGQNIIFTGIVKANPLIMPNAANVYIVGGTSPAGIVANRLQMNDGGSPCPTSSDSTATRARLYLKTGSIALGGSDSARMCNTTVILMGGHVDACLPTLSPYAAVYDDTPCPGNTAGNGQLKVIGGPTIDWTAPDLLGDGATETDYEQLEDLALWTETYGDQNIGGGGWMHLAGVFMAPNADAFKISGGGTQDVTNSQYVVRKLWNTGNGRLKMMPQDSLPIREPILVYSLVR